jgi:hypothetical protein
VKQYIKETSEFSAEQSNQQVKRLHASSAFKQVTKEATDFWHARERREIGPNGRPGVIHQQTPGQNR